MDFDEKGLRWSVYDPPSKDSHLFKDRVIYTFLEENNISCMDLKECLEGMKNKEYHLLKFHCIHFAEEMRLWFISLEKIGKAKKIKDDGDVFTQKTNF